MASFLDNIVMRIRAFLSPLSLENFILEKYQRILRQRNVSAEIRGTALVIQTEQLRNAYGVIEELEKTAKARKLNVKKYVEMSRGTEMQVVELSLA